MIRDEWIREAAVKLKLTSMESVAQSFDELAAEDAAEHADGQEEGAPGGDPTGVIRSQAAGGNDTVDMRMELQSLIPAVEHAEETDLGTKMPWITSDFKQGLSARVKEQVVDEPFVLQRERGQFPRQSEHGVDIASGQQFLFARLEPASARVALASRAMPVAARVVGDPGRMSAAGAAIAMPTERSRAAACDGQQHLLVLPVDPPAAVFHKCLSSAANDVGHLHERPVVQLCLCPPLEESVRASSGLAVALRCRWDRCR